MKVIATEKKIEFQTRLKRGLKFENSLPEYLYQRFGIKTYPYGLGTLPGFARKSLIKLDDPTSQYLRYAPDYYCLLPKDRYTFCVECKSEMTSTPYYSFCLDSYNFNRRLVELGVLILCVFPDPNPFGESYKAEWIENLPIEKTIKNRKYLKTVNGSGNPFVLIRKAELRTLDEILKKILSGNINRYEE